MDSPASSSSLPFPLALRRQDQRVEFCSAPDSLNASSSRFFSWFSFCPFQPPAIFHRGTAGGLKATTDQMEREGSTSQHQTVRNHIIGPARICMWPGNANQMPESEWIQGNKLLKRRDKRQQREREICLRKVLASGWKTIASARLAMDI